METYNIQNVEVFSVGTWNGDEYTVEDLNEIVKAFNENKPGLTPYLKLGHDDNQELLQKDGYPAAGWVSHLYVRGDKLMADFTDIPKKIFDLIMAKAYRKVSCEIFWNLKIGEKLYKRALGAVALLGANTPGVMNLADIISAYKKNGNTVKIYNGLDWDIKELKQNRKDSETMEKTEKEIKLEYDLKTKQDELAQLEAKKIELEELAKAKDQELETLKQFKLDAEKKELELKKEAEKAKLEKFTSELITEKLCTPGMKPLVEQFLGEEKKEYSVNEKNVSKQELLKEILKLYKAASEVNFEENSSTGDDKSKDEVQEDEIQKYMAEHKCRYGQAVKAVLAMKKNKE